MILIEVAICVVLICLLICKIYKLHTETMIISPVDGKSYTVKKKFHNIQTASNILARLNKINIIMIRHLEKKYKKSTWADGVNFLRNNYNNGILEENFPSGKQNTSYVINKGDEVRICLRDINSGKIHDFNTLVFVNLHELSHMLDKNYGHNASFWTSFKFILCEAVSLGLYNPVDYKKYPVSYCGIKITSNPYFDEKMACPKPCINGVGSCKPK